jgi:hypothetical protein
MARERDGVVSTVVRYDVDEQSVREAAASPEKVTASLREMQRALEASGSRSAIAIRETIDEFERLRAEVNALSTDIRAIPDPEVGDIVGRRGRAPERRRPGALETTDRVGTVGSQIAGGLGGSELGNALGLVGDLAGSVQSLGIAGGVTALAVGGISIALTEFNKVVEAGKRQLAAALQAQNAYFNAVANFTSTEAQARIEELNRQQTLLLEQLAVVSGQAADAARQQQDTFGTVGDDLVRLFTDTPAEELSAEFERLNTQLQQTQNENTRLQQGLEANAFAANDAAEAAERAAEAERALANERLRALNERIGIEQRVSELARTGNQAQLDSLFESIQSQATIISRALRELEASDDFSEEANNQIIAYRDQLRALGLEYELLGQRAAPLIAQREAEAAAQERALLASEALFEATTNTVAAQEAAAGAAMALADAQNEVNRRLEQVRQQAADREAEIVATAAKDIARIESEGAASRQKVVEDDQKATARILKRFSRTFQQAVGERDALAGRQAVLARDDENEAQKDALTERQRDLESSLKKQVEATRQRGQEQLAAARDNARRALQVELDRANSELNTRRQAFQRAQVDLLNAQAGERAIRAQGYAQAAADVFSAAVNIGRQFAAGITSAVRGSITSGTGGGRAVPVATGIRANGISINVYGNTSADIRNAVDRQLVAAFRNARTVLEG